MNIYKFIKLYSTPYNIWRMSRLLPNNSNEFVVIDCITKINTPVLIMMTL